MIAARPLPEEDLRHILGHTAPLWEETRGKSFFITGGTGFFGMWLLESFAHINDALTLRATITVLTRDPAAFADKAPHLASRADIRLIQGDIRDFIFPKEKFTYLIHAATEASAKLNSEAPHEMLDAIVAGMRHTLNFSTAAGVEKLLFTSSGAVYGPQPPSITHISENHIGAPDCLNPDCAYAEGKRVAELMAAIHARSSACEIKIARCFAFVGPHLPLDAHFAIGNFLRDILTGKPIKIAGDGTPYRSYLHAADLTIWLWTILFKAQHLRPYNVGSAHDFPLSALAEILTSRFNPEQSSEIHGKPILGQPASRYVPDTARAASELGLLERIPLEEAVARTLAWHQHSPTR